MADTELKSFELIDGINYVRYPGESVMTDAQLIDYLGRYSNDLDDQSIVERFHILEWLKAKRDRTRTEEKWVGILEQINRPELDFLHAPSSYKGCHPRPCWPKWRWDQELRILGRQCRKETWESS